MKNTLRIAACLAALASPSALAQVTSVWFERVSASGTPVVTRQLTAPTDSFTVHGTGGYDSYLQVRINQGMSNEAWLDLGASSAYSPIFPTVYEEATSPTFRRDGYGALQFFQFGVECSTDGGRFVVREWVVQNHAVVRASINFEQRCSDGGAIFGEARINSSDPFTFQEPAGSVAPDMFYFLPLSRQATGTQVLSSTTTIYGINAPAPITIEAGSEYSINGGAFTGAPGTVNNRDRVRVRTTTPMTTGTTKTVAVTVGGATSTWLVATFESSGPITALYYRSQPGATVGNGATESFFPSAFDVRHEVRENGGRIDFSIGDIGPQFRQIWFRAGQPLAPGVYEEAVSVWDQAGHLPGILYGGGGVYCERPVGRFVVHEVEWSSPGVLARFAADFEQRCEYGAPAGLGELRYNSTVPLSYMRTGPDTDPTAWALQAQSPARAGALVTSNSFSVTGVSQPVPISVTGGEYSVNGGAFTSQPGTVQDFDRVTVRMTAAAAAGATANASLRIGAHERVLAATTWAPGTLLSGLQFASEAGNPIGAGASGLHLAPHNQVRTQLGSVGNSVEMFVLTRRNVSWGLRFRAANGVPLTVGTHANAKSGSELAPTADPMLGVSSSSGQCPAPTLGQFTVHEIQYGAGTAIDRFAADFELDCNGRKLRGQVRHNSAVPFGALDGSTCQGDTDGDGIPDCVEVEEGRNPSAKDNDIFANARWFAMQQYRDFLAREGDAGGIAYWASQVAGGASSRSAAIQAFLLSPEFAGVIAPVARLYFAYFTRVPDKDGLDFWVDYHLAGNSLESVSSFFAQSPEFVQTYGALDNAAFVDRVYRNVLGRAPEAAGLAFWTSQLDAGARNRGQVMLAFSESPEYMAIIANEVFVTMAYLGMLQRAPEPAGYAFWVDYMDQGNAGLALIDGFLGSGEYRGRFLP